MIDEEKRMAESQKIARIAELALEVDIELLREVRPDAEFLATALDGWIGDMMRTALGSIDAFLEYREKVDVILADSGLDMLMKGWPKDA